MFFIPFQSSEQCQKIINCDGKKRGSIRLVIEIMIDYGGQHMDSSIFKTKVDSAEAVIDKFYDTLIDTNRVIIFSSLTRLKEKI